MISLASPAFTVSLSSSSPIPRPTPCRTPALFHLLFLPSTDSAAQPSQTTHHKPKPTHVNPAPPPPAPPRPTRACRMGREGREWGKGGGGGGGRPLLGSALFP